MAKTKPINKKIVPQCLNSVKTLAVDNRGRLLPCCECDHGRFNIGQNNLATENYIKLLDVSHISNYDEIEDILWTKEWHNFAQDLKNNIAPVWCYNVCRPEGRGMSHEQYDTNGQKKLIRANQME